MKIMLFDGNIWFCKEQHFSPKVCFPQSVCFPKQNTKGIYLGMDKGHVEE